MAPVYFLSYLEADMGLSPGIGGYPRIHSGTHSQDKQIKYIKIQTTSKHVIIRKRMPRKNSVLICV